uniref:Uncharacterized protein n=1 Tax=Timema tahoe TaxID=61484 RepID=A0A7R9IM29_9NEOP|nr:unnamed protein product [Timema tahoe]
MERASFAYETGPFHSISASPKAWAGSSVINRPQVANWPQHHRKITFSLVACACGGLIFPAYLWKHSLVGIALLTLGALIQATITEVTDFMAGKFSVPSIALIIVGSIVFIVAFYGCCGAIRESSCMVTTVS